MSIEKNIETLAENSTRIAAALEGILAAINNGGGARPAPAVAGSDQPSGVTSGKVVEGTAEADAKAAKAKAKAEKAVKEEAAARAAADSKLAAKIGTKPAGTTVSYDSIKALVTEMAGTPDGVTAIRSVFKTFGVVKASDLPEEKWGELLAALEKAKAGDAGEAEFA